MHKFIFSSQLRMLPASVQRAIWGQGIANCGWLWFLLALLFLFTTFSKISALAILVFLGSLYAAYKLKPRLLPLYSPLLFGSFALYLAVAFVASCLTAQVVLSNVGFGMTLIWAMCLVSGYIFSRLNPGHDYAFIQPMVVFLAISAVLVLALDATGLFKLAVFEEFRFRLFTPGPNRLGMLCAFGLFFCVNSVLFSKETKSKIFFVLCSLALVTALVFSVSRTIMFLMPLGFVLLLLLLPFAQTKRALPLVIACVLVAGIIFAGRPAADVQKQVIQAFQNPRQFITFQTRVPIWEVGWESFLASPWVGNGVHSFKNLYNPYRVAHETEWKKKYSNYELTNWQAHNIVLSRLVETGLLGTVPFFLFYFLGIVCAARAAPRNRWFAAFLLFYFCVGMLDDHLSRVNESTIILLIGLAVGLLPAKQQLVPQSG